MCIRKTRVSFGPLGFKPACFIEPETAPEINDENINVTIKNSTPDMEVFTIRNGDIWYFPNIIQFEFPNLVGVEIIESKLKKISKENIVNATKLIYLDLSGNEIQELDKNLFHNNLALTNIHLKDNEIKKIHPTAFDGPKTIVNLNLQNNVCLDMKIDKIVLAIVIEKIRITCWNQYEFMEKIEDIKKINSILISNLTSQMQKLEPKLAEIDSIKKDLAIITDELSKRNITFKPSEAPTTTTTATPDSYILHAMNISLTSFIPFQFKSMDISIVNCGLITFIFVLLLCCTCCRRSPKPIENLKTIIVKSSDYERMKEMTTIRKSVHPATADDAQNNYDLPLKDKSENGYIREAESERSFDDVLDEEENAVQTDWLVAYKAESRDRE